MRPHKGPSVSRFYALCSSLEKGAAVSEKGPLKEGMLHNALFQGKDQLSPLCQPSAAWCSPPLLYTTSAIPHHSAAATSTVISAAQYTSRPLSKEQEGGTTGASFGPVAPSGFAWRQK